MVDGAPMFHWHYDTFDLPKLPPPANPAAAPRPAAADGQRAAQLAAMLCKNQAFRFKTRLFGFQYHFEFDARRHRSDAWPATASNLTKAHGPGRRGRSRQDTEKHYPRYARLGDKHPPEFRAVPEGVFRGRLRPCGLSAGSREHGEGTIYGEASGRARMQFCLASTFSRCVAIAARTAASVPGRLLGPSLVRADR